ncbi:MAG: diguanylate cyclase domain-containing protein [bacterium]
MRTLRAKVAVVVLGTVFGLLAVVTLIQAFQQQRVQLTEQREASIAGARALAQSIGIERFVRTEAVSALIKQYARTPGVQNLRVMNREYRVIAASSTQNIGRVYRSPDVQEALEHGVSAATVTRTVWTPELRVVVPIRDGAELAGALEIEFTLTAAQAGLWTFFRRAALVALLATGVLTLVLLWSLTLVVVRPITRYARVSQDLARGDFSIEIPEQGPDEIGQLGRALAKTRDSMRELSRLWKDQDPLTGLPGTQAIQRELRRRMESGEGFVTLYVDLDGFKAFNDRYGFERGDELILFTACLLAEALATYGGPQDFLGHASGDDFVLILDPRKAELAARAAIQRFEAGVLDFIDEEDRERGLISGKDGQGGQGQLPLASLTIVGVPVAARHANILKIGEAASELRTQAKRQPGSKFVMERGSTVGAEPAS